MKENVIESVLNIADLKAADFEEMPHGERSIGVMRRLAGKVITDTINAGHPGQFKPTEQYLLH